METLKTMVTKKGKEVKVPKYFTLSLHTDAYPYETVEVISEQTVVVRPMKSTIDPDWKPEMHPGGFAAHCSNQRSQRWNYSSDEKAGTFRIRRKKKPRTIRKFNNELNKFVEETVYDWTRGGSRFVPSDKPYRFHDYNF